jgi:hypothetical protein
MGIAEEFSVERHACGWLPSGLDRELFYIGVRNLSLAIAGLAFDGINFAAWLHWLHHDWEARSIAGRAGMLLDLRTFDAAHFGALPH